MTVLDDEKQKALTGNDAKTTVALLNRDVKVDENGNPVDSAGNSTAGTLKLIFDAEKVQKELNAQVKITQAFGQQAYQAVGNYIQVERDRLRGELAGAITDEDKAAVREQLQTLETEERVMNILIAAVTGQGATAVTKEGLSLAADQMRELMIEDSLKSAGITDGETVLTNATKDSDGVRGDEFGLGGTRLDLDKLCGPDNRRCKTNEDGSLKLDEAGRVQWNRDGADNLSLSAFLETDEGKQAAGATGGIQGYKGTLFGVPYEAGGWQDKLIESFAGTHDMIGGKLSGLYDQDGNIRRGMTDAERSFYDNVVTTTAILPSAPFAAAELLSPEVW